MTQAPLPSEPTYSDMTPVTALGFNIIRTTWKSARRLIDCQLGPQSMKLDKVLIGATVYEGRTWEGRRVEKDVVISACVHNTGNVMENCQAIWFTEDVPQIHEAEVVNEPAPAVPPIVNSGAPHSGAEPTNTVHVAGAQVHQAVPLVPNAGPVQVGQLAVPQPGPPPANMQPGMQYVQHIGGPLATGTPPAAFTSGSPPTTTTQRNGQTYIHMGGAAPAHVAQGGTIVPGPGEVALLLTREDCRKVARVLHGAIFRPDETNGVMNSIASALERGQSQISPGSNEIALKVTIQQAKRIQAIVNGTDHQEISSLHTTFELAATT